MSRLRVIQTELRKARSSTPASSGGRASPAISNVGSTTTGYKPFMKRLEPPVFSGKIGDWPEFRSVWQDLLADFPESVQVQHLKANIPETDAKRVVGVKTMEEMWRRLEKVYGDTELNIITIKTNLENFSPKATTDYRRIMEVFEAIETAVTQLDNLKALQYLKEDFGLMSKLVLKLPAADQRQYSQYVSSAIIKADPRSRWDKFWVWIEQLNESAIQSSLMHMCDRTAASKASNVTKSGVTCSTCGGVGHYARFCPTKTKNGGLGAQVKVNLAVTKITTRDEYNKYLPETKKEIGKCPSCCQPAHSYTHQFSFGQAQWPSNRLESCPQFALKSVKERGELVEKLKGCYKCTSFKHSADGCFIRGKTNCKVMTGGTACSGAHHKMLHGSGVAFCHKVSVTAVNAHTIADNAGVSSDDLETPPDLNQPVLLEVQHVPVSGTMSKIMFDNGCSVAIVTHSFASKANLQGKAVSYWLAVVGHQPILKKTTLYTMYLRDNKGHDHEVLAYGIDMISEDSTTSETHLSRSSV